MKNLNAIIERTKRELTQMILSDEFWPASQALDNLRHFEAHTQTEILNEDDKMWFSALLDLTAGGGWEDSTDKSDLQCFAGFVLGGRSSCWQAVAQ